MNIGVDLGGTKIEAVLSDEEGKVLQRERVETPKEDYEALLQAATGLVEKFNRQAPGSTIGFGTPGAISQQTGRMKNCNNTCLNGKSLKEDLEARLGCVVRIANDADCFTLSESIDGIAANADSVFGVILGTGVGGGICIKKSILSGPNGIAGEWGHTHLPVQAYKAFVGQSIDNPVSGIRSCYCGAKDCVETWLSGPALEKTYLEQSGLSCTAREIHARYRKGEFLAEQVLRQYFVLLAMALSNVINVVDPQTIVLGGGLSNIDEIYSEMPVHLTHFVFSDDVRTSIVKAQHGDSSGVRGAAWLWRDKLWSG